MNTRDAKIIALNAAAFVVQAAGDDADFFLENHGQEPTEKNKKKFREALEKIAETLGRRAIRLED